MESGWDRCGMGMGSLWPRMAPAGCRGPDGRVARSDVTVALGVCAVSSGRSRVPHGCGGGCTVTPTPGCWGGGGCSLRAPPGCCPWGGDMGFRIGGVARATPLKTSPRPQLRSLEAGSEGPGRGTVWAGGVAEVSDASGAGAEPPGFQWGEGSGEGHGARGRTGCCGSGGYTQRPPLGLQDRQLQPHWSVRPVPRSQCQGHVAGHTGTPSHAGCPQGARVPHPHLPSRGLSGVPARPGGCRCQCCLSWWAGARRGPHCAGGWWPLTVTSLRASLSKVNWILQMYSVH